MLSPMKELKLVHKPPVPIATTSCYEPLFLPGLNIRACSKRVKRVTMEYLFAPSRDSQYFLIMYFTYIFGYTIHVYTKITVHIAVFSLQCLTTIKKKTS